MITATTLDQQGFGIPATLDELRTYLQAAMEVEHLTIPVYMTGMYTITPGTNRTAYFVLRSVLLEEMLHMTLAANLLNAVGGEPKVGRKEFVAPYPVQLPFSSRKLPKIGLQHFSPKALETFLTIERPRAMAPKPQPGDGWTSIGQFYDCIRKGLDNLVRDLGHGAVFTGDPNRQVGPEDFYNSGGEVFAIHHQDQAHTAIRVISEQGEGVEGSIWDSDDLIFGEERQLAHYFRFNEIYTGRSYGPHDLPKDPPSGPLVDVTWDGAYRIDGTSTLAQYREYAETSDVYAQAAAFHTRYAALLGYLQAAFNGTPRAMALAIPTMLELRDRSEQLYRNPHPDPERAAQGIGASPTFEIGDLNFQEARPHVEQNLALAGLEAGAPIDLSALSPETSETFA
ncbi:ferritin-like domain-containing protein [Streptomyces gilvosporeus]|uniref:ferritin-like domain-containing protein n=1 Tax=Streptomyces gilvosporeus TaxID=553510 RepID=UPI000D1B34C4|nr:ferritin-like protein [Streptomyces gilvosporeus]